MDESRLKHQVLLQYRLLYHRKTYPTRSFDSVLLIQECIIMLSFYIFYVTRFDCGGRFLQRFEMTQVFRSYQFSGVKRSWVNPDIGGRVAALYYLRSNTFSAQRWYLYPDILYIASWSLLRDSANEVGASAIS